MKDIMQMNEQAAKDSFKHHVSIQTLCRSCNSSKAAKTMQDWESMK